MFASVANRVANYGDRYYAVNTKYFLKKLKKTVTGTGRRAVRRFALLLRSSRVCDLQKEIAIFLRHKNLPYADQFFDPRWLARLALLTDITKHMNALNGKLQGKYILVTDMHTNITAFEVKLRSWETQLANSQLEHFPRLAACVSDDVEPDTCNSVVASQREEFASRFAGVRPEAADFKLFTPPPLDFPVDDAPVPAYGVGGATVQ